MSQPVIALLTDFGYESPFVGVVKGVICSRLPEVRIIDLTHSIEAYNVAEAGFWLQRSYAYLPESTVYISVVDPGVGTERQILAAKVGDRVFLAPDNGLLDYALANAAEIVYRALDLQVLKEPFLLDTISSTFHGRDIFAPIAVALVAKHCAFEELGPVITDIVKTTIQPPVEESDCIAGNILSVDRYGNLITDLDSTLLQGKVGVRLVCSGQDFPIQQTYGQAEKGKCVALINSFGVFEIACVEGNAAAMLNFERGARVELHFQK